ncbi:ankyrin repeat domain-containing protein 26-like isoform X19 [Canis lupus dingo]|uniref:ankyrin repeat domain-containing protein 26-like isoform X19 n=1 Tax=Canis lupus dingo TaxID=286419 RepID=UPI0020C1F612|nr:ankyrin repeat domain-containing protein 26-like isoform X19 [Canis lupus dingo]
MKKRSTARNGWGLLRFGFNLRPLRVRSPPMTMTVDSFHSPGPGYHIRYQDLRGIHRAVIEGDTEKMQEIQQLLVFGLHDLNKRDRKNRTALHLACAIGSVDMVKILVLSQCQLNLRDGENRTALVKAVQCQEEACVDILLRKGADVNTKDFKDNTALHYAAYEGNISIARKLLLNKGDIEAKNKDGLTPLLVAVNEKKEKMVAFLLEEANINAVDYTNRSCLHLACANGHEDMVKLLVDRKCQLNLRDVENTTALLKAVQSQDEACVDILLKHGANPDLKDIKGNTALHYAALGDNVTIAQKLLLKKVNMEIRNKDGLTPLLLAINEKKEKMVAFLVEKANINAVDYAKRTALHLACAIGREDMVKLLVDRHCQLNLCDGEDRTALVKAIQCQEEACVTLLLEHGADPKVKDNKGNTALHYAAHEGIVSIAEKLLLQNANIEAKNTDGLTPVLVALNENKEQMVKFLVGKGARLLSGDTVKSSDQLISEHEEEMKPENSSQNHDLVAKKSEEVSLSSRTRKADTDDSRPSKHEDLSSGTKTVPKLNLRKQMAAFLRPKKAKCGLVSQEDRPLFADNNFAREDKTETLCKPSVNVSDYSPLAFVSPETPQTSSAMLGVTKTGKERKQHTSNKMEGAENIYDAAAAAAAAPALGTALAVAAAAAAAAPAAGLIQQRKTGKTDNHLFPTTQNEDSDSNDPGLSIMEIKKDKNVKWASKASVITPGFEEADSLTGSLLRVSNDNSLSKMDQDERRPAKKTSKEKNKVKKQVNSAEHLDDEHLDDLTQSSETASEDCKLQYSDYKSSLLLIELGMDCKDSVSVLTIQNAILKYKRSIELKRKDCEQLTRKILQVEYKVNGLEQLLSETKEMKSQLEHQKVEWERELYSLRLTLKQEKEKRRSAEILYINIKEQLRSKEELSEVSPPHEKEKGLLHENRMLQDELAMLRLEIDTIRNQKQEKRYCEDTETEKEKNDSLQNAIKLNEVTLTNTVFQSSGQLNVVTTENTMLNSKLQDEKLNRERLEAKLQSYRARVATAIQDRDQSQASKRDLELAFQRAKDEWCHLQDKMNFEMSNLKDNNEVLSQQLSEVESKLNALEIELQYTRDALREKTLALEHLQRNPKQTQGQKKEIEQKSQNEQGKVNEYMGKHESLEEKLSQLQSENMLLREQLDDAYSRVECKEKTIIYLKDQVQVIVRMVRVAGEKRALQLRERNKELINKCKQIMERAFRYEDEKEERERQEAKELQTKVVRCVQKFRDDIKKLEVENAELKVTVKEQAGQIEQLQKDLLSSSSVSQSLNFCPKEKEFLYL